EGRAGRGEDLEAVGAGADQRRRARADPTAGSAAAGASALGRLTLRDRLLARIRGRGPITFAQFMESALFDPEDGYYTSRVALGFEGDYLTAPDLGPHFGRALARAFVDLWARLGRPAVWDLVEAGAGRGVFLRDVL